MYGKHDIKGNTDLLEGDGLTQSVKHASNCQEVMGLIPAQVRVSIMCPSETEVTVSLL